MVFDLSIQDESFCDKRVRANIFFLLSINIVFVEQQEIWVGRMLYGAISLSCTG